VNIQLDGSAQIIMALLVGLGSFLKALAVFLPVWRDKARGRAVSEAEAPIAPAKTARYRWLQ
jgi:hypothetical protein